MPRTDTTQTAAATPRDTAAGRSAGPLTPADVLRGLPEGATPAQQDSAIQAVFTPKGGHASTRPDTLHLPGHGQGRDVTAVSLRQYWREGFFKTDTLLPAGRPAGAFGVAGDPVPQTMRADSVVTTVLLLCLIFGLTAVSRSRRFIARQAKSFFRAPRDEAAGVTETTGEIHFQLFLVLQACLLLALLQYSYTREHIATVFRLDSPYQLMAVFMAVFAAYFALKGLLYAAVNAVFFSRRGNRLWLKSLLFITSAEGVAVFPAAVLHVYFGLPLQSVGWYLAFVLAAVKLLTFYKCLIIFFRRPGGFLQIILYFCTLEMAPLAMLWGTLVTTGNLLKLNI